MVKRFLSLIFALIALVLQPTSVEATTPTMYCAQGTITNGTTTLNSVPVTLVAAKGANTIIRVVTACIKVVPVSAFWINSGNLTIKYSSITAGQQIVAATTLSGSTVAYAAAQNIASATATDIRNTAVVLQGASDTGVTGSATITYRVIYYVAASNH
jgi:hypothetical protein